jgi:hypothetical protein
MSAVTKEWPSALQKETWARNPNRDARSVTMDRIVYLIRREDGKYWGTPRYDPTLGRKVHFGVAFESARIWTVEAYAKKYARQNGGAVVPYLLEKWSE